ncbi:MAG: hypothetical protein ACTSRZ_17970 [Promethearchaeota archaeon]
MSFRNIKELEVYFKENYSDWWKGYKEALKDVLRLIDECRCHDGARFEMELKAKIEG